MSNFDKGISCTHCSLNSVQPLQGNYHRLTIANISQPANTANGCQPGSDHCFLRLQHKPPNLTFPCWGESCNRKSWCCQFFARFHRCNQKTFLAPRFKLTSLFISAQAVLYNQTNCSLYFIWKDRMKTRCIWLRIERVCLDLIARTRGERMTWRSI